MRNGDLVQFEYLLKHASGVGWELQRCCGIIIDDDVIMANDGRLIKRSDVVLDSICLYSE